MVFIYGDSFISQVANDQCTKKPATVMPNANQMIFDIHNEASALLLKSYISIQLSCMVLKVTDAGKLPSINHICHIKFELCVLAPFRKCWCRVVLRHGVVLLFNFHCRLLFARRKCKTKVGRQSSIVPRTL